MKFRFLPTIIRLLNHCVLISLCNKILKKQKKLLYFCKPELKSWEQTDAIKILIKTWKKGKGIYLKQGNDHSHFTFPPISSLSEGSSSLEHAEWKIQVYVLVGSFDSFTGFFFLNDCTKFRWSVYHLSARDVHKPHAFYSPVCFLNTHWVFFNLFLFIPIFFPVQWGLNQAKSHLKILRH